MPCQILEEGGGGEAETKKGRKRGKEAEIRGSGGEREGAEGDDRRRGAEGAGSWGRQAGITRS